MGDISLRGRGRALLAKGGKAMDESMAHENAEPMKMESKETRMEKKGFIETKKGKMVKKMAKGSLPDLTGDGKVTKADVLKGRGVFKKGGTTMPSIPPYLKRGMKKIGLKDGGQTKVGKVMREFKSGKLHSGKKGPVVKSRKQAIAIALSEAGKSKKK
jgi:hypothetical protein